VIGHIYIYGEIGKQVTLDTVLKAIEGKFSGYVVHIHSNGGDVFEGYAIYNAIKNTGKNITVHVEGTCASIATLIASAGSKIIMNLKSAWMIHNPRITSMGGDAKDLRNVAGQLDKIKSQLIDSWVGRTTLTREALSEMYDHETWLTPEQAVELGFVDEVQDVLKAVASADIKKFNQMEDKKNFLNRIEKMINNFFSPKNMTDTLEDGRVIQVETEDGDWTGKRVTTEDGAVLPAGAYKLADGRSLTVDDAGVITQVTEVEAKTEEKPEDMEAKEKLAAAEARIKELESALNATSEASTKAEARAKSFENKALTLESKLNTDLKAVKDELEKIKNTTAGDATPPKLPVNQPVAGAPAFVDPMQAWFKQNIIDKRNTD
jgi:ATP-dependent protease ClpP protease subunit